MPTPTNDIIYSTTLASAVTNFNITGFASTYKDLILEIVIPGLSGNSGIGLRFNSDSTNGNYGMLSYTATGALLNSYDSARVAYATTFGASVPGVIHMNIMSYASSTAKKVVDFRTSGFGTTWDEGGHSVWRSTAAITNINVLTTSGTNFNTGTIVNLYGVKG